MPVTSVAGILRLGAYSRTAHHAFDEAGVRLGSVGQTRRAKNRLVLLCSCSVPI
jgi:hypothetical protein